MGRVLYVLQRNIKRYKKAHKGSVGYIPVIILKIYNEYLVNEFRWIEKSRLFKPRMII